jgi:DNA-binding XRE family transcriptional regulator
MITNERQYAITRAAAARFEQALSGLDASPDLSPAQRDLERRGLQSQLKDLQAELTQYESLREGRSRVVVVSSLLDVPGVLISARVGAGLTQKQLAERLRVREQQVQQDEATVYSGASLERLHTIATILGVSISGIACLPERGKLPTVPSTVELLGEADGLPALAKSNA